MMITDEHAMMKMQPSDVYSSRLPGTSGQEEVSCQLAAVILLKPLWLQLLRWDQPFGNLLPRSSG